MCGINVIMQEREIRNTRGNTTLKLQVFSLLAQCHLIEGNVEEAIDIFSRAVELTEKEDTSRLDKNSSRILKRWRAHMWFQILKAHAREIDKGSYEDGDNEDASKASLNALEKLDSLRNFLSYEEKTVLSLSHAVISMKQGDPDAADKRLTETATELGNAFKKNTSPMKIALESLRAHYYLLYALNAQLSGRAGQLASGGSYPAFEQFFKSMEKIDKMKEECSHFDGLGICDLQPPLDNSCASVLGEMLQASLLRISGRSGDAAVHLGQIEENLTSLADEVGLTNRDNSYGIHQQTIQKPVTQLQLLAYEYRCLASLVICDFQAAAKACLQAGALFKQHSESLHQHVGSFSLLLGQYFHSTKEYETALSLFESVIQSGPKPLRTMAVLCAALTDLHESNGLPTASMRMKDHELDSPSRLNSLPSHERSIAQMINGLILYRQGDSTGARLLLTKSLKQAHGMVGSGQFVGQVLNCLAPVQQERNDHPGALQMFESSATLLKSVKDLMSLVTTLKGMERLYQDMKDESKLASCRQYLDKKSGELITRLQVAYDTKDHKECISLANFMKNINPL